MKYLVSVIVGLQATACLAHQSHPLQPRASAKVVCPIVLPGQVALSTQPSDFDSNITSLFKYNNVKGPKPWSQILLFPELTHASRFDDVDKYKPLEVTIDDESIFKTQYGFRRAGLQFKNDTNPIGGPGNSGVKTLHWSVRQDSERALNLTHEYLNVWHEKADYSGNQFNFQTGLLIGRPQYPVDTFKFLNIQNEVVWSVPISYCSWQNFAITLDFDAK
jgi:hypothetical protein